MWDLSLQIISVTWMKWTKEGIITAIGDSFLSQADRHSVQQWKQLTGGLHPRKVTMLTKQRCIDLCVKGYHSKDEKLITELKTVLVDVGKQLFYLMDIDHDG